MNLANELALYELPSCSVVLLYHDPTCIRNSMGLIPVKEPELFIFFSFSLIADVSYVW